MLAYQAWTYWVFRKRVITPGVPAAPAAAAPAGPALDVASAGSGQGVAGDGAGLDAAPPALARVPPGASLTGRRPQDPKARRARAAAVGTESSRVRPLDPRLLRYASRARLPIAALAVLGAVSAGLTIVQAQFLATAIAGAFTDHATLAALAVPVAGLAIVVGPRGHRLGDPGRRAPRERGGHRAAVGTVVLAHAVAAGTVLAGREAHRRVGGSSPPRASTTWTATSPATCRR